MTRLRFAIGRWLLRPLTRKLYRHYVEAEKRQREKGNYKEAEHCAYILIGISYVGAHSSMEYGL